MNHRTGCSWYKIGSVYSLQPHAVMYSSLSNVLLLLVYVGSYDACTTVDNTPCVFPFIYQVFSSCSFSLLLNTNYQGVNHSECTNATDSSGKLWCATKVDKNGFYINKSKQWGYCSEECPSSPSRYRIIL